MSEDKYLKKISKKPILRVAAWVGIILILGLIIATFIAGITGSEYFFGFLVLSITVPVFIYVVLWIGRVLNNVAENRTGGDENNSK